MIEAKNLEKTYLLGGTEVHALRGVDLRIEYGEFIAILGPSGSGKSTLLNLLGALDRPTSGVVLIEEKDISALSDRELSRIRREKIGFVFQRSNLIPSLNSIENVIMPRLPVEKNAKRLEGKGVKLLDSVGLSHRVSHMPTELSGGERQRVAVARSLINDPMTVLADEPTGNLDTKTSKEIMDLMKRFNKEHNQTFVVVSHDPMVSDYADRTIHIIDGKVSQG